MRAASDGKPHGLNRKATTRPMQPLTTESVKMVIMPIAAKRIAAMASVNPAGFVEPLLYDFAENRADFSLLFPWVCGTMIENWEVF